MTKPYVKRLGSQETVDEIEVTNPSQRKIEKIMRGMLHQMNTDEYYIDDSEFDNLYQEGGDKQ